VHYIQQDVMNSWRSNNTRVVDTSFGANRNSGANNAVVI